MQISCEEMEKIYYAKQHRKNCIHRDSRVFHDSHGPDKHKIK